MYNISVMSQLVGPTIPHLMVPFWKILEKKIINAIHIDISVPKIVCLFLPWLSHILESDKGSVTQVLFLDSWISVVSFTSQMICGNNSDKN